MKIISSLIITLFLLHSDLYACSCKGAIAYAKETNAKKRKGRIPDIRLQRYVFECTGILEKLESLDQLDKDLLYMKASSYTRERFENSKTKTETPRMFSELLSKEHIDKLFEVMHKIYTDQDTNVR